MCITPMFYMTDIFKSCVAQDESMGGILDYIGQMPHIFLVLPIHRMKLLVIKNSLVLEQRLIQNQLNYSQYFDHIEVFSSQLLSAI